MTLTFGPETLLKDTAHTLFIGTLQLKYDTVWADGWG